MRVKIVIGLFTLYILQMISHSKNVLHNFSLSLCDPFFIRDYFIFCVL